MTMKLATIECQRYEPFNIHVSRCEHMKKHAMSWECQEERSEFEESMQMYHVLLVDA